MADPSYAGTGTQTSSLEDNVTPTVISRAREAIEKPTIMTNKNVVRREMIRDGDGLTYNDPKFGDLFQAQALSEGVPINNPQTMIPTTQQFTTSEVGVMTIITDKAKRVTKEAMAARAGRFMGNAMKRKREITALALFSGLSRDLGGTGNSFAPNAIAAAVTRLRAGSESGQTEPAEGDITAIVHPYHIYDVLTSSATLGSNSNDSNGYFPIPGWTEQLIREYDIRRLYGVNVVAAPLIAIDASDDAVGAIFNNQAFIYVGTSHSLTTETDRDVTLRADLMVMTAEYGYGESEDQFGFKDTADATPPTS